MDEIEIWKDVPGYEGIYQASTFGNIKSLRRNKVLNNYKPEVYYQKTLCKNGNRKMFRVHQIIAMTFLGFIPNKHISIIDHKDDNKLNNRLSNLQIVTSRENNNKRIRFEHKSKEHGVSWESETNKWRVRIVINKVRIHIGRFYSEIEASNMYKKALNNIHLFDGDKKKFKDLIV